MKEGLCEICTFTKVDYTLERDSSGWTTSITWTFKLYNNVNYQKQTIVMDADGNTEEHIVPTVIEENLIKTESATYAIPIDQRTQATHEEPHVHENETAFQAAYRIWADTHRESDTGKEFWSIFNS
tara:strand:+ start:58 stop:435 length:378 start_codon:yes stop_codon:yes gene_type:complete